MYFSFRFILTQNISFHVLSRQPVYELISFRFRIAFLDPKHENTLHELPALEHQSTFPLSIIFHLIQVNLSKKLLSTSVQMASSVLCTAETNIPRSILY